MMHPRRLITLTTMAAAIVVIGCRKKPETAPAPTQTAATPTETCGPACRDSIARERAREDSIRRAREAADAAGNAARDAAARAKASLTAKILFDYDQSDLSNEARTILDSKIGLLKKNPSIRIMISGHADERGSDEYNIALGQRRAAAAKRYLTDQGIDPSRIQITSYGEERPSMAGVSEDAYRQNRRDEFEIIAGGENIVPTG